MSRYAAMFDRCAQRGEGAFGAYLMLGDPDPTASAAYLDALVEGGADMLELGIPFSDPVADGPVIQAAAVRALAAGVRTADCLRMIADFRARHPDVPVGILTYANIVAAQGIGRFAAELAEAGADSLLVADVPTLEAQPYADAARAAGIDLVMIAAPNTPPPALARIASLSSGYTYCVARSGVTGADRGPTLHHSPLFGALAEAGAPPPILGFGISTPEQVRQGIAAGAAGVVCGSALVRLVAAGASPSSLSSFVSELKAATRPATQNLAFAVEKR
jgi:tryptophan synthase alpha chain